MQNTATSIGSPDGMQTQSALPDISPELVGIRQAISRSLFATPDGHCDVPLLCGLSLECSCKDTLLHTQSHPDDDVAVTDCTDCKADEHTGAQP